MVRSFSPAFRFSKKSEADDAIRNVNGYTIPGKFALLGHFLGFCAVKTCLRDALKIVKDANSVPHVDPPNL
jgi:hypothetical protein